MNLFKNPQEQKPIEELIKECELEAEEALKDPYVFEKPIQNVAVIGAGPSGVSWREANFIKVSDLNFCAVTCYQTFEGGGN